jgi:hypothetical protein
MILGVKRRKAVFSHLTSHPELHEENVPNNSMYRADHRATAPRLTSFKTLPVEAIFVGSTGYAPSRNGSELLFDCCSLTTSPFRGRLSLNWLPTEYAKDKGRLRLTSTRRPTNSGTFPVYSASMALPDPEQVVMSVSIAQAPYGDQTL